ERLEGRGQGMFALPVQGHREAGATEQHDRAVDAGERGKRRGAVDLGDAHPPEELRAAVGGRLDDYFSGTAETVLPRPGRTILQADDHVLAALGKMDDMTAAACTAARR